MSSFGDIRSALHGRDVIQLNQALVRFRGNRAEAESVANYILNCKDIDIMPKDRLMWRSTYYHGGGSSNKHALSLDIGMDDSYIAYLLVAQHIVPLKEFYGPHPIWCAILPYVTELQEHVSSNIELDIIYKFDKYCHEPSEESWHDLRGASHNAIGLLGSPVTCLVNYIHRLNHSQLIEHYLSITCNGKSNTVKYEKVKYDINQYLLKEYKCPT